ncbi:MAG TPA: transaldolase [Acidimicrobiales bacterium]|nr:transaldolase [Acidimicrobiales bacterium]
MTRLQDLHRVGGQSPWLDNLKRAYLSSGKLAELVSLGVRGLTSNPTIMAKAIAGSDDYDAAFSTALASGQNVEEAYWDLVIADVSGALGVLRQVYDESDGGDGFVSIEVSPRLAHDTDGTIGSAKELHERIDQPNLLVKIPATREGLPAIEAMIAQGRSINVTLIFSLERYRQVIEAYLSGLETLVSGGGDASKVASVASFFVSRVDTETDRRLEQIAKDDPDSPTAARALAMRGTAAVAQARLAYRVYLESFAGSRWQALEQAGARRQRPLWASTSTKNPAYPDLAYVDTLVAQNTVNTMPEETIELYLDHGKLEPITEADLAAAEATFERLGACGIDLADVATVLETEGVAAFAASFEDLLGKLQEKADALGAAS